MGGVVKFTNGYYGNIYYIYPFDPGDCLFITSENIDDDVGV